MKAVWSALWAGASVALLAAAAWSSEAPATGLVHVPNFWNGASRPEKPDTSTLRVIRFLTEDDYPPFDFVAPDGTLTGFNVDLARAICDELKVACTVQARRWDTLIDALNEGRGDAAIASLRVTEAARRTADFTAPYYKTPARFVARKTSQLSDTTPESLAGKILGVEKGTAHEAYLRAFFPRAEIRPYDNPTSLRSALRSGSVDALFGDGVTLALWLNGTDAEDCCVFKGGPYTDSHFFGDGIGIAVKKNNVGLRRALDDALAQLAARGIYADLYLKYFPIGFY